jgi:hypothetical protein
VDRSDTKYVDQGGNVVYITGKGDLRQIGWRVGSASSP